MKLATASDVLARGNVSQAVGSSTAVDSALEAATTVVASILQTELEENDRVDYFDYNASRFQSSFPGVVLKLQQRFVFGGVQVFFSQDGTPATTSVDLKLAATSYAVNASRGTINLFSEPLEGVRTIAVKYTAGFTEGSSDIPSWMKQAAISAALHVQHIQAIAHNKDDQPDMAKAMAGILYTQINSFITVDYGAISPTDSVLL